MQEREACAREEERAMAVRAVSGPDASLHTGRDLGVLEHEPRDLVAVGRVVVRARVDRGQEQREREGGQERKSSDAYRQAVHLSLRHRGRGWPERFRSGSHTRTATG